jgi:pectate lyase
MTKNRRPKWRIIFFSLLIFSHSYAQRADFGLVGFATENGGTTGGAGGVVHTVSTFNDLKLYAEEANTPYIIQISGTIEHGPDGGMIKVASNKTIFGLSTDALLNGVGLDIKGGAHNIIIQNVRFTMMGVTTRVDKANVYSSTGDEGRPQILTNGGDCIRLFGPCNNVWVDHCEFFSEDPAVQTNIDLYDGLLDITHEAGFVTVSWCYFHDHHKCHLVGSSETDLFADRKVTFHHNYYRNIGTRLPLFRGSTAHVFNNYTMETHGGSECRLDACIRSEKNYLENSRNTVFSNATYPGYAEIIDNKEVNCTHPSPFPSACTASIPYVYANVLTNIVDSVKFIVTHYAGVGKLHGVCSPPVTSSKATILCFGDSTILTGVKGTSYIWKEGSTVIGTDSAYKVKTAGLYTVELTDTLGCRAVSDTIPVIFASSITWYEDTDGDGKGNPNVQQTICTQPLGYVTDNSDLCPADPNKIAPGLCGCGQTELSCVDCNGVPQGSAIADNCDRCIGGNTGRTACATAGEAETEACAFQGVFENTNLGFKGTGYINSTNVAGASVTFSIFSQTGGIGTISFRYANGTAVNHSAEITVNDVFNSVLAFAGTSGFTVYKTQEAQLTLAQGNNIVKLIANTSDGLANIDQIGYVTTGLAKDACPVAGINKNNIDKHILAYPNPFNGQLTIEESAPFTYRIFNFSGEEVEKGSFDDHGMVGGELSSGLYILEVTKGDQLKRIKIAKQ